MGREFPDRGGRIMTVEEINISISRNLDVKYINNGGGKYLQIRRPFGILIDLSMEEAKELSESLIKLFKILPEEES